jgi:hypothetical protein
MARHASRNMSHARRIVNCNLSHRPIPVILSLVPSEGMALVERQPGIEAVIVDQDGQQSRPACVTDLPTMNC